MKEPRRFIYNDDDGFVVPNTEWRLTRNRTKGSTKYALRYKTHFVRNFETVNVAENFVNSDAAESWEYQECTFCGKPIFNLNGFWRHTLDDTPMCVEDPEKAKAQLFDLKKGPVCGVCNNPIAWTHLDGSELCNNAPGWEIQPITPLSGLQLWSVYYNGKFMRCFHTKTDAFEYIDIQEEEMKQNNSPSSDNPDITDNPRVSYVVNSRNGYHPIDRYLGKSLQRSLIIPKLSKGDAQRVADWLNQGYCSGLIDGQTFTP